MAIPRPSSTTFTTAFPAADTPLANTQNGGPATPWLQLLRALWLRTGSQPGIDGATLAQAASDQALLTAINFATMLAVN